jgi:hypothetical protein
MARPAVAQPGVAQPGVAQPGVPEPGVARPGMAPVGRRSPRISRPMHEHAPTVPASRPNHGQLDRRVAPLPFPALSDMDCLAYAAVRRIGDAPISTPPAPSANPFSPLWSQLGVRLLCPGRVGFVWSACCVECAVSRVGFDRNLAISISSGDISDVVITNGRSRAFRH